MQGAAIDESNTSAFGTITNINDAGNYEFTTICHVVNSSTIVVEGVQRTYNPTGAVQLVHIPVYSDAEITAPLTAAGWNGSTGGVLAFECTGTLTMNSDINTSGLGFRGGTVTTSTYSCTWIFNVIGHHFNITSGEGAMKGEGIAKYIAGKTAGRGPQANGGGGGNDHNSGGGGGGNADTGGQGGQRIKPSTFACQGLSPGLGGKPNAYSNTINKLFLGGGGGAGHENNVAKATAGSNGGGLVIIKANNLVANGNTINAQGAPVAINSEDGAGGGGAGGTVLLDITTYSDVLNVDVNGGDGGSVSNVGPFNCNGPGGGGSGGVLWVQQSTLPANINLNNSGGLNGTTANTTQGNCTLNGANNATAGNAGSFRTGLSLVQTTCSVPLTTQSATICNSDSLFLAGDWQSTSGVFYDTVTTSCCDSIFETTLTVLPAALGTLNETICFGDSIVINGTSYSSSVTGAIEIFVNSGPNGCDSTVTINLTVLSPIDTSTSQTGLVLSSNQAGASYQWIDCTNGNSPITGATGADYTATSNGDYAVIVSIGSCSATSACISITDVGIIENRLAEEVHLFPNPTSGNFTLDLGLSYSSVEVAITDLQGRLVQSTAHRHSRILNLQLDEPTGIYLVHVQAGEHKVVLTLVNE